MLKKNLERAILNNAIFIDAQLERANIRDAQLENADLRGANLKKADLYGANLRGANLRGADLKGAYLYCANLMGADLRDADLRGAYLNDANLEKANLTDAKLESSLWCRTFCIDIVCDEKNLEYINNKNVVFEISGRKRDTYEAKCRNRLRRVEYCNQHDSACYDSLSSTGFYSDSEDEENDQWNE